jgi:hypothetical protein
MSRRLSKSAWGTGVMVMVMRGGRSGLRARPLSSMAAISAQIEHFPEVLARAPVHAHVHIMLS